MPALSARLNAAVESEDSVFDLPALSDAEREEVRRAITAFEAAHAPTEPSEIERMLGKLSVMFPNTNTSTAEAKARVALYAEMLSDIPADILSQAFRKVAMSSKFFPTVAEIRSAAQHGLAMRSWRLMRLKMMALRYDREAA